jgi:hypothetical protein
MQELKHLNLTEKDFELLVEALEFLPEKGMTGELVGDLMIGMMAKDSKDQHRLLEERRRQSAKKNEGKKALREDVKILQGKLLMLKRFLVQEGALKEAYEAIDPKLKHE